MRASNRISVAQALEKEMKIRTLAITGIALAGLLAGGWAVAQSTGHRHDQINGQHGVHGQNQHGMHGQNRHSMHEQKGPGMRGQKGHGMRGHMGHGMMGMHHGNATEAEHDDIRSLFFNHDQIKRTVTNLPDGIRTVTESDNPEVAGTIKRHVKEMGVRVEQGRDPNLPIESPALRAIFLNKDKIKSTYEVTEKGIVVVQTSADTDTAKALQVHAAEVTQFVERGMAAAHEAMMRNMHGMHGAMTGPRHQH